MQGLLTTQLDAEAKAPLKYFHRWVKLSNPNEFDKPTKQELTLLGMGILLAPTIIAFASIWIFFQPEFLELPSGKRLLFALVIPLLLPPAYCYVVFVDLIRPLFLRIRLRARMLREADKALQELVKGIR